ncbi:MAG: cobalamin-dependent protein [Nitrospirae bacterium YQR-1]
MEELSSVDVVNKHVEYMTKSLLSVDKLQVKKMLMELKESYEPIAIVERIIVPSLEQIGEGWMTDTVSLSQVYMSGKICSEILDDVIPHEQINRQQQLKMAIATLEDFHTLGKQIVKGFLYASGFEVADYGGGLTVGSLVERVIRDKTDVLLISVLMLPSALSIKEVRKQLRERHAATIIVAGGAPFNFDDELFKEVEADYAGRTVSDAIHIVRTLENNKGV